MLVSLEGAPTWRLHNIYVTICTQPRFQSFSAIIECDGTPQADEELCPGCLVLSLRFHTSVARYAPIARVGLGARLICTYYNGVLISKTYALRLANVYSFSHLQKNSLYRNKHKIRHCCGSRH